MVDPNILPALHIQETSSLITPERLDGTNYKNNTI